MALLIQDCSDLNFATRPGCRGLSPFAKNRKPSGTLGPHMHSTCGGGKEEDRLASLVQAVLVRLPVI